MDTMTPCDLCRTSYAEKTLGRGFVCAECYLYNVKRNCSNAYGSVNIPKAAWKKHHARTHDASVGGTNNDARAMFGLDGQPMCAVVTDLSTLHATDRIGTAHSDTYRGYHNPTRGVKRSAHTVERKGVPVTGMSWDYIMRKCAKLDISLVEYCEMYNFPVAAIAALAPSE